MKSYTDLEQSKKLAEILPVESADMTWEQVTNSLTKDFTWKPTIGLDSAIKYNLFSYRNGYVLPCWSLAALIEVLPDSIKDEDGVEFGLNIQKTYIEYYNPSMGALYATYHSIMSEDTVDACYEMVLKLHEQKLL